MSVKWQRLFMEFMGFGFWLRESAMVWNTEISSLQTLRLLACRCRSLHLLSEEKLTFKIMSIPTEQLGLPIYKDTSHTRINPPFFYLRIKARCYLLWCGQTVRSLFNFFLLCTV